ncbi:MAG: class I SAM-dependent methyltransferase [Gammaproteobacteria bacterium]|nr:class I SAM-dependent methyltransferase [Gammaproteobacteria bacterium]MDH5594558.1 class I SAM-dependent methyltransferase [Gammaproteobacteria bacterium]
MQNYKTKHETISVNKIDYLIRSLKDRQQFSDDDQLAEKIGISSASWPLFGIVWPASRVLADTVSVIELGNKRVLEIGCGIGLSSIVLHKMGINITASDYHPLAQEFLDENILRNELPPIKFLTGNWETENPLLGEYDLIIGSDILYEPAHAESVSSFIDCHSGTDVQVIIVDPNRGNRAIFTKKMIALGYTHHFDRFDVQELDEPRCKGRILHYQRQ